MDDTICDSIVSKLTANFDKRFDELVLTNKSISNDLLNIRNVLIENLVQENRRLQSTVNLLADRLIKVERQTNQSEQNNRKNNLEIDGIPASVKDPELKSMVTKILDHVATSNITENDIEAVHRLQGKRQPQSTIVRLKRNLVDEIKEKENRKKVRNAATHVGLPQGTALFINDNQSPNMKNLAYNARLLKRNNVIVDTWFSNAAVRVKTLEGKVLKITHEIDLYDNFPDFQDYTFDVSLFQEPNIDDRDMLRYRDLEGAWPTFFPPPLHPDRGTGLIDQAAVAETMLNSLPRGNITVRRRSLPS